MSLFNQIVGVVSLDTIVALVLGILGGQKLRITLGGKKLPVKGRYPKASGRRVEPTSRSVSVGAPSLSPDNPELPYMVDPAS